MQCYITKADEVVLNSLEVVMGQLSQAHMKVRLQSLVF